jgi:hypothetical protein
MMCGSSEEDHAFQAECGYNSADLTGWSMCSADAKSLHEPYHDTWNDVGDERCRGDGEGAKSEAQAKRRMCGVQHGWGQ